MQEIGIIVDPSGLMLVILFAFGLGYNWFVGQIGDRQRGFTAILVVGGVLVTLGGLAFMDGVEVAVHALICFAATGFPMVVGSIYRYICEREAEARQAWQRAQEACRESSQN